MSPQTLKRLNTRLADLRGRNPHGWPIYRWFHSSELTYPCRTSERTYEHFRQLDDDQWVIAKWEPSPSLEHWKAQFPDLGYQPQGQYYVTDMMLAPGMEPNDTLTDSIAGAIKINGTKSFRDFLDEIEGRREKRERSFQSKVEDFVDDACAAYDHMPGTRGGHVSFGGIDKGTTETN